MRIYLRFGSLFGEPEVCVCLRLRVFVCLRLRLQTPPSITPPFAAGPKLGTELKMSSRGLPAPWPKSESKTTQKKSGKFNTFQLFRLLFKSIPWGCAKGAAKGSCGETVVQKGVFGESVSSLLP